MKHNSDNAGDDREDGMGQGASSLALVCNQENGVSIEVGVLDTNGKIYRLDVRKSSSVKLLKQSLVNVSGVEYDRQRIIFRGRILNDSDQLDEAKVEDQSVLHLFQRPKVVPPVSTTSLVQSSETNTNHGASYTNPVNVLSAELPDDDSESRQGIRFLAMILFLICTMQLFECLAFLSNDDESGEKNDCHVPASTPMLLVRSIFGLLVGALGYKVSQGLNMYAVRAYQIMLLVEALISLLARFQLIYFLLTGQLHDCKCTYIGEGDEFSSQVSSNHSSFSDDQIGSFRCKEYTEEVNFSTVTALIVFQIFLPGMIWFWCLVRARQYGNEIIRNFDERYQTVSTVQLIENSESV